MMHPVIAGFTVVVCVFSGGLFGLFAERFLPSRHLTKDTQDVVRLATGTVSVLASLVLGLLIATAKGTSDTTDAALRHYATDMLMLDGALREYGPAALPARQLLSRYTRRTLQDIWPGVAGASVDLDEVSAETLINQTAREVRDLVPANPGQQWQREIALETANGLLRERWLLIEQSGQAVQPVIVVILVCWVTAIFASFGLNAPRNGTVLGAFFICSLAIGAAVYLVLEMDSPFSGLLRVSEIPMQRALAHMER